ncbi:hypothetical protein JCM5296_002620 [Sporobolomyces johnsonii]
MPPPPKRRRSPSRSPSPALPAHLLTSLPSTTGAADPALSHLFIQAHEATLIRGQDELARLMESRAQENGRLGRWAGSRGEVDGEGEEKEEGEGVWVDRYDILNLLPSLPPHLASRLASSSSLPPPLRTRTPSPALSAGFSDLPSDHEELFYFDELERDEIARKKKRRRMDDERTERVRLLEARDRADLGGDDSPDETLPSPTQLALMRKLATTLSSAADPTMLEIRILTHHGADERFAFLRKGGKWRDVWERIRRGERVGGEKGEEKEEREEKGGLGGLAAYGSDSEDEGEEEAVEKVLDAEAVDAVDAASTLQPGPAAAVEDDEARRKQEARAEKAREWARKRLAAREAAEREGEPGEAAAGQ